jgi:hypothetical protein
MIRTGVSADDRRIRAAPPGAVGSGSGIVPLSTSPGDLDLLGEAVGGGTYETLLPRSAPVLAFGARFLCVGLESLIGLKRAAGWAKDLESIAELQAILEERRRGPG